AGPRDVGDGLHSRAAQTRRAACGICPLLSALRFAADAEHAAPRLRGGPPGAALGRMGRWVDELVPLHLSVQSDAAAGRVHTLRANARWASDRPPNRRRDRRGRPGAASKPGLRSGQTVLRPDGSPHAAGYQFGERFSMNARTPSLASAVAAMLQKFSTASPMPRL